MIAATKFDPYTRRMYETPVLNVVVLGGSAAGRAVADVLRDAVVPSAGGTPVPIYCRVWTPDTSTETAAVDAADVQVIIACLDETAGQVAMIRRAIAAGKHVLAFPPIAEKRADAADLIDLAQHAGIVTGVTETADEVLPFLEGIVTGQTRVPDWRSWVGVSNDPADEILAAIASLPPKDKAGRAKLLRALDLLREGRGE